MYALGAVAYRALSGRTPAEAPARVESAARKQADPLSPVAAASAGEVSAEFGAAVASALALWPEDRPRDVPAWRAQWDGGSVVGSVIAAGGDAGRASSGAENLPSRGPSSRDPRTLGADRRAVAAVLAVVVGVAVGIAGWVWDGTPGDTAESTSSVTVGEPLPVPGAPVSDQDSSPGAPGRDTMGTETENAADTVESVSPVAVGEPLPVPTVADVQAELARHGLYAGDIDGEWGPRTARAARAYASVLGIPAAGFDLRDPVQFADLASEEVLAGRDDLPLDCHACPEMVVIPAGDFMMGSPTSEEGRWADESPQHQVAVSSFALGRYEVTRDEYRVFVETTGHPSSGCWIRNEDSSWTNDDDASWREPGFAQGSGHPAVCVNWNDAQAYVRWLSRETGESYRLPSEAEWEYAARGGALTSRYWGDSSSSQCGYANGADAAMRRVYSEGGQVAACDDGAVHTTSAGSYSANAFGLFDVLGNVLEWTADCVHESYRGAPADGSPWHGGDCDRRVLRGGSWSGALQYMRSAARYWHFTEIGYDYFGFRVARTLD